MRARMVLVAVATTLACVPAQARADVVALGDSAISGEAGRWAGNTNNSYTRVDALGSTAYWDTPSGEAIRGCHRSKAAQAHIGDGVASANLACSGARTSTTGTGSGQTFKPGIDFYSDSSGRKGQAAALEDYARTHNVRAVVVMIGANNYGFAAILERCVTNWITSPSWFKNYCSDDSDMTSRFTSARQAQETANVRDALLRVRQAMANDGYSESQYTIIAQTYWSPIPAGQRDPLPRERLDAPVDRRLRRVEPRPQLGQRHRRARAEQQPSQRRGAVGDLQHRRARPPGLAGRPAAVRERGRATRGGRRLHVAEPGRRRSHRVGRADPHHEHDHRPLPAAGGRARQLLGPTRDAQLPPPRLQRRRRPGRSLRQGRERPRLTRRAADGPAIALERRCDA
jgi:hypothetical protein